MNATRTAGYATAAWTLPVVVWIAGGLLVESTEPGGAARASARMAPLLPVVQVFALALLVPALAWRQPWIRSVGIAALILVAPWPVATLLAQTAGVSFFGLGVGQLIVAVWALVAITTTRMMAVNEAAPVHRLPATQGLLIIAAVALTKALLPVFSGVVAQ